jgi:putative ABC transport system ATP-binding protein
LQVIERLIRRIKRDVALRRAPANDPQMLLADEPTGSLDSKLSAQMLDLLIELQRERHLTLVVVTHSEEIAARAVRLCDGRIVDGSVA